MSVDTSHRSAAGRSLRIDLLRPHHGGFSARHGLALVALGCLVSLLGSGARDLNAMEAPLGIAAGEPIGPYGRVDGLWSPTLLPGQVLPSQLWLRWWVGGDQADPTAVHIPAALAFVLTGLIVARRAWTVMGARAGVLAGLAFLTSLAACERPHAFGFEPWAGLAVVAALDRIFGKGSDWVAGLWAALAVLAGGWPALVAILLPILVIGRSGSYVSVRLMVPPLLAFAGWSAWALASAPAVVWGEALVLPIRHPTSWTFLPAVVVFALPWVPLALMLAWRGTRNAVGEDGIDLVTSWLKAAAALALVGTLVPGMARPAFVPILGALALAAGSGLDAATRVDLGRSGRRTLLGLVFALAIGWAAVAIPWGAYLAAAIPYYRPAAIVSLCFAIITGAFAIVGTWERRIGWAIGIVLAVAVAVKVAHATVYVPEWNYRVGQGPWGRAIGQWVPPRWEIYVFKPWPPDLAFATERSFRRLGSPKLLKYEVDELDHPAFVLLSPSEFEHWPETAPPLLKVREFSDPMGRQSVLARTEGEIIARPPDE